jgi:hypothetical protein
VEPFLYLGHAALGGLLLGAPFAPAAWRRKLVVLVAGAGVALSIALLAASESLAEWRSTEPTSLAAPVAVTLACAWVMAALTPPTAMSWRVGALVGVAGAGLVVAATSAWSVPALLFWECQSIALAAVAAPARRRASVWVALFASDGALVAVLIAHALEAEGWRLPADLDGWPMYALIAASVVRSGVLPRLASWGLVETQSAPALPLMTGGAFVLLGPALGSAEPWPAAGLLALATALFAWQLVEHEVNSALVGSGVVAVMMGASLALPAALPAAAIGALVAVTLLTLWPLAGPGAGPARALATALVPPLAGFVALGAAGTDALTRAADATEVTVVVPWGVVSVLVFVTLALAVSVAARIARAESGVAAAASERGGGRAPKTAGASVLSFARREPVALASGLLAAASVGVSVAPLDVVGRGEIAGLPVRSAGLLAAAAALGAVGAGAARRRAGALAPEAVAGPPPSFAPLGPAPGGRIDRALVWAAVSLAAGVVGATGWITVEGLRVGFL